MEYPIDFIDVYAQIGKLRSLTYCIESTAIDLNNQYGLTEDIDRALNLINVLEDEENQLKREVEKLERLITHALQNEN